MNENNQVHTSYTHALYKGANHNKYGIYSSLGNFHP